MEKGKCDGCGNRCSHRVGIWFTELIVNNYSWLLLGILIVTALCIFGIPYYLSNMVLVFMAPSYKESYKGHVQMKEYFPLMESFAQLIMYVDREKVKIESDGEEEEPGLENYDIREEEEVSLFFSKIYEEMNEEYPGYILGYDNYYTMTAPDSELDLVALGFVDSTHTAAYCVVTINKLDESQNALNFISRLGYKMNEYGEKYLPEYFTSTIGMDSMFLEIMGSTGEDVIIMISLSLPFAFVIIGLYLKSAKFIIFPLLVVLFSALISLGISAILPATMDVLPFVPGLQAAILLAMSIDYTLFISSALKRELLLSNSFVSAIHKTIITGGKIVLVSGVLLLITLLSMCFMGNTILITMGLGMAICLVIIVLIGPVLELSLVMFFPNFFTSYSYNINSKLVFMTEADDNTFKIRPNVAAKIQKILNKKVLNKYDENGKKIIINEFNSNVQSDSNKNTENSSSVSSSSSSTSTTTATYSNIEISNSHKNMSDKNLNSQNDIISYSNIDDFDKLSTSDENQELIKHNKNNSTNSKNHGDGKNLNVKLPWYYHMLTQKAAYKHSFPKGDRPEIDRVPIGDEREILQEKDFMFRVGGIIVKIPFNIIVIVLCLLILIPGIIGLTELQITFDNLETIPKGSDIVYGLTTFGDKFSQGFAFPFIILISPEDDSAPVNLIQQDIFDMANGMIQELVEKYKDESDILNESLITSPSYLNGIEIMANLAEGLLDNTFENEFLEDISAAYKYVCGMYLNEERTAMQIFLAPNIPWSAVGSDTMTTRVREVIKSDENVALLQQYHLRADLFSMYADIYDSSDVMNATFPILTVVIVILLAVVSGIIYKSLLASVKLILTIIIIIVVTFGVCSLVFNDINGKGYYWFVPSCVLPLVVGLGTDYDTFLFTTIYHKRLTGMKDKEALVAGLYDSGKTIIAAGLIMTTSFIGLAFSSVSAMMEIGTILVTAVVLEGLVMIPLFVPGLLSLFGRALWFPQHIASDS